MPQSLHVLSVHIVFSTKERRPWIAKDIQARLWAYQSRILQNVECHSITIGGVEDHVHVSCHLTKKVAPTKVIEVLKKDSFASSRSTECRLTSGTCGVEEMNCPDRARDL